ncbi:hypothetical protein CCP2SC5_2810001 [Azospirillaceae bacterium]
MRQELDVVRSVGNISVSLLALIFAFGAFVGAGGLALIGLLKWRARRRSHDSSSSSSVSDSSSVASSNGATRFLEHQDILSSMTPTEHKQQTTV